MEGLSRDLSKRIHAYLEDFSINFRLNSIAEGCCWLIYQIFSMFFSYCSLSLKPETTFYAYTKDFKFESRESHNKQNIDRIPNRYKIIECQLS